MKYNAQWFTAMVFVAREFVSSILVAFAVFALTGCNETTRGADFVEGKAVEVKSVSAIVNQGEMSLSAAGKADTLKLQFSGTIGVANGVRCELCAETMNIGPKVRVPTTLFQESKVEQGPGAVVSQTLKDLVGEVEVPKSATEFIVAGPEGATLKKVDRGFLLVKGAAHIELEKR
jgi:hypothetical protein